MSNGKRKYLIFTTFLAMLIMALTDSTRGILVPTFKTIFNVSDTAIGTFLAVYSLTYLVMSYIASLLCTKYGQKKMIILGMAIAGSGFLMTSFAQVFNHILVGYVVITSGIALMVMGMNTILPLLKVSYLALLMNLLHFFYGVGSTITQKITAYLIYTGISWRTVFMGYFLLYIIGLILYLFVQEPVENHEDKIAQKQAIQHKKLLVISCLALGFYVSSEMHTANWLVNYLKEVKGMNTNVGATYTALFFGVFSIGRLLGGFVVEKFGYMRSIITSLCFALLLYSAGLIVGGKSLYLISLSGLFFAITYPTFLIVVQKLFVNNATYVTGIVVMVSSAISMIVGYLIGVLNDYLGTGISIYLIPISLLLCIILMIRIKKELDVLSETEADPLMSVQ